MHGLGYILWGQQSHGFREKSEDKRRKNPEDSKILSTGWLECLTKMVKTGKNQDSEEKRNQNLQGRREAGYNLHVDPIH